jgi:folate-dependent phosphoribosylglycinamide formyltransferase PurN
MPQDPVRIVLCTSGGLHGAQVLARLAADPRVQVVGVVFSSRVLGKRDGWLRGVWALYRRSGLRYLLYLWTATALAERLAPLDSVEGRAKAASIPLHVSRDINDPGGVAFVERCKPQLLVSAFFNQRIAPGLLQLPSAGSVNIHPSLLPDLKGVDPVFFARLRGVAPLGVTLHRVVQDLDAGPVLAQARVDIAASDSVLAITARLFERGADLLLDKLDAILAGDPGVAQQGVGSYDSWPSSGQVGRLHHSGGALVRAADLRRLFRRRSTQA